MWNNKSLQTLFFFATKPNGMQVQMQRPNLFNTFGSVHNNTLSWVFERRGFATLTDKERAQREKEKEREKREKEQKKARALKEREQERAQREKEKEKNLRERERQKNKEAELKAKEKAKAAREKAQALKAKEKERETLQKQKEKDRREKEKLQAEKEKEQEKKRRAKDLKAMQPKRSKSAYVFYVTEQMPALRQKTGEPVAAVMKQLAAKWPTLTESEKKVYEDMAAKDKERHLSEKESFAKTQPPKKPLTAYILFYNDIRETIVKENPGIAVTEMSKIVGQKWNEISKGEKDKYTKKAQEAAEKYAAELALFEKQ